MQVLNEAEPKEKADFAVTVQKRLAEKQDSATSYIAELYDKACDGDDESFCELQRILYSE